jgi:hypothetical protein
MTEQERRNTIQLVAVDGIGGIGKHADRDEALDYVLRAICTELAAVSIKEEETTAPALRVMGAMVGGLFGIGNEATDDEMMVRLHERGSELQAAIGN